MNSKTIKQRRADIIKMAAEILKERFPELEAYSLPANKYPPQSVKNYILLSLNATGEPYVGVYLNNSESYFAVLANSHDDGYKADIFMNMSGRMEDSLSNGFDRNIRTLQDLRDEIEMRLSNFRPGLRRFAICLQGAGTTGAKFIAIPEVDPSVNCTDPEIDRVSSVSASDAEAALRNFMALHPRTDAFKEMIRAGLNELQPNAPTL